jgi:hypothetical protein
VTSPADRPRWAIYEMLHLSYAFTTKGAFFLVCGVMSDEHPDFSFMQYKG